MLCVTLYIYNRRISIYNRTIFLTPHQKLNGYLLNKLKLLWSRFWAQKQLRISLVNCPQKLPQRYKIQFLNFKLKRSTHKRQNILERHYNIWFISKFIKYVNSFVMMEWNATFWFFFIWLHCFLSILLYCF